jgi:hypothetical protein
MSVFARRAPVLAWAGWILVLLGRGRGPGADNRAQERYSSDSCSLGRDPDDIDVLINRTLVYGLLTAVLAGLYIGQVIALQALFRAVTGQASDLAIAVSTLVIAAVFNPLRHRIQDFIARIFYRRKYDAVQVLSAFGATCRDETDLGKLQAGLMRVVEETLQPAHVSLWLAASRQEGIHD